MLRLTAGHFLRSGLLDPEVSKIEPRSKIKGERNETLSLPEASGLPKNDVRGSQRIVYSHAADYDCGLSIFDHPTGQAQDQAFRTVKAGG
jgi:hypothetical protein